LANYIKIYTTEHILHGGTEALRILHRIFARVWEYKVFPE